MDGRNEIKNEIPHHHSNSQRGEKYSFHFEIIGATNVSGFSVRDCE